MGAGEVYARAQGGCSAAPRKKCHCGSVGLRCAAFGARIGWFNSCQDSIWSQFAATDTYLNSEKGGLYFLSTVGVLL